MPRRASLATLSAVERGSIVFEETLVESQDEELWHDDDSDGRDGWFCVRTDPFPCPAAGCTYVADFMTAAHLILVWEEQDDPNLLRHAARARRRRPQPADRRLPRRLRPVAPPTTRGSPPAGPCTACGRSSDGDRHRDVPGAGIRCERCMARLGHVLKGHEGLESANATLPGDVTLSTTTS